MHRSGTSLVSSLVAGLGVDMGGDLLPADSHNPRGYHEDVEFVRFHGRVFERCTREDDGGHRDWGWTESESLEEGLLAGFREEAAALLAARAQAGEPWGWKDPRTSILLDFWDALSGHRARYLFVYRYPWDVADSMQRLGAPVFLENPGYAYRIWQFYNRRILDFCRRWPERTALVSVNALLERTDHVRWLVEQRLGVKPRARGQEHLVSPGELRRVEGGDPLIRLTGALSPGSLDLLRALDHDADLSARGRWTDTPATIAQASAKVRRSLLIATPCHDDAEYLVEAIASVERTAPGCEHVIVNDGSRKPRTLDILDMLGRLGYTVLAQPNRGLAAARNRAIAATSKRYVLPLDADNRLRPGFVETAVEALEEEPRAGVAHGDWWEFGMRNGLHEVEWYDSERLMWSNTIDACAVVRREAWEAVGGYDPMTSPFEDWALWLGIGLAGWRFKKVPGVTFDYRVRPGSLISAADRPEVAERVALRVVERYRRDYLRVLFEKIGHVTHWPLALERELIAAEARAQTAERELAREQELRAQEALLESADRARLEGEIGRLQSRLEELEAGIERLSGSRAWATLNLYRGTAGRIRRILDPE